MGDDRRQIRAAAATIAAFTGFAGGSAVAVAFFVVLGVATGVLRSCSTAPAWWESAFEPISVVLIVAVGAASARRSWRRELTAIDELQRR